jgi:hypothetical protein
MHPSSDPDRLLLSTFSEHVNLSCLYIGKAIVIVSYIWLLHMVTARCKGSSSSSSSSPHYPVLACLYYMVTMQG